MTKKEHECVESQRWTEDRVSGFIPSCLHLVSPLCESIKLFVLRPLGEKGLIGGKVCSTTNSTVWHSLVC